MKIENKEQKKDRIATFLKITISPEKLIIYLFSILFLNEQFTVVESMHVTTRVLIITGQILPLVFMIQQFLMILGSQV